MALCPADPQFMMDVLAEALCDPSEGSSFRGEMVERVSEGGNRARVDDVDAGP